MDKVEVKKFIEEALRLSTETTSVEFKDARGGLPKITWRAVSAFSHKPGDGIIAFGIAEDKENKKFNIVGVGNIAYLQRKSVIW